MQDDDSQMAVHHISDQELVCSADGELSRQRAAAIDAHLKACWNCRARMQEIQSAIAHFSRAHRAEFDERIPPVRGSRALLRARLAEYSSETRSGRWKSIFQLGWSRVAFVCLPLIAITIGMSWFWHAAHRPASAWFDPEDTPNRSLTPGVTRQVTMSEVCSVPREEVISGVSVSLRHRVLQEYGILNARPEDYEIDYLIAPRLGGTEDIRNLWPEPYRARLWNAHVKDALEERLHEMVCKGQVDLVTAQHDIATDWIAAYKKYFHTNKPLSLGS